MSSLKKYRFVEDTPRTGLARLVDSMRAIVTGPWSSSLHEGGWWGNQSSSVTSGVMVNEYTALNYSAVWAAVSIISSQVGNLPLILYRLDGNNRKRYVTSKLYRLLHDRPNPEMSAFTMREIMQAHLLIWGNAYAEIEEDGAGRPAALWPLTPDRVRPFRASPHAALQYLVQQPNGEPLLFDARKMLHIPGLGWDGTQGYSVIAMARESLGLGIAAEKFGGSLYGNNLTFGGVISYPGGRPPEVAEKNLEEQLNRKHQGPANAHRLLALYNGAKYERMGVPPNDAQFLETRSFQVDEVARWFNLPPHKLKELTRSTNNNIEHQNLEYYIDCLAPWLKRWEQELGEKLISPLERNQQEIEFVADGLLRGDVAARGEFHSKQWQVGAITNNEIRALENRNPIDGGDVSFVPLTHIPLDLSREYWEAQIESAKAPKVAPPAAKPEPDPEKERQILQLTEERDLARKKAQEAEDLRDHAVALATDAETKAVAATVRCAELETQVARVTAHDAMVELDFQRVCKEKQEQIAWAGNCEAVIAELRTQITTQTTDADKRQEELLKAHTDLVLAEARAEEKAAERALSDALAKQLAASLNDTQRRLDDAGLATRAVIIDNLKWLIDHESDRARRVQGSPDKLRKWLEQFYPEHGERCRRVLRPSVRAWVVCTGHPEPVEHLLDLLVAQYLEQSERQLRTVADEHDSETMPIALEKLLRRWEADRAETVADRVLKEVA